MMMSCGNEMKTRLSLTAAVAAATTAAAVGLLYMYARGYKLRVLSGEETGCSGCERACRDEGEEKEEEEEEEEEVNDQLVVHGARTDNEARQSSQKKGSKGLEIGLGREHSDPYRRHKRRGYLTWDEYFMSVAFLSAMRSKDPRRQVGAVIVSQDKVVLGIGYNGFPRGSDNDDVLPWAKESRSGDPLETKHPYVCHAEMNAIVNKNAASVSGGTLYVVRTTHANSHFDSCSHDGVQLCACELRATSEGG